MPHPKINRVTSKHKAIARYRFKNPATTNAEVAKKFSVTRQWIVHLYSEDLFKEYLAGLEAKKDEAVIKDVSLYQAQKEIDAINGQEVIGDFIVSVPKSEGEKRIKFEAAKHAVEWKDKRDEPKAPGPAGTINIDSMQINIAEMPIEKAKEFLMNLLEGGDG